MYFILILKVRFCLEVSVAASVDPSEFIVSLPSPVKTKIVSELINEQSCATDEVVIFTTINF